MAEVLITPDMLNNLNYDMDNTGGVGTKTDTGTADGDVIKESTVLIIFSHSDINAAIYHLSKSLEAPWERKAVGTVLVQESIKNDFIEKLQPHLKPYEHPNPKFITSLALAKKLNAKIIGNLGNEKIGPSLVCDFTHDHFGGNQPTGIVTLHIFRTAKEAISLVSKETLNFAYASIWHENHSYAYELVAALKTSKFFINCFHVPLTILEASASQGKSFVAMDKSYHYETLNFGDLQKSIVFPYGSIFAN